MKYIIRAVKYFLYIICLMAVILAILVLLKLVDGNIESMFRNGYSSVLLIAVFFAVMSAIYPLVGYCRQEAAIGGSLQDNAGAIKDYFSKKRYVLETCSDEVMTFRRKSFSEKLSRVFEDRITVTQSLSGVDLEGLRKDVIGLALGLEGIFNKEE